MSQVALKQEREIVKEWKRYPAYKDSGVEWLGEIPSHWEVKRLKFLSFLTMGQSPNSEDYNHNGYGAPFLQGNAEFGSKNPKPKVFCYTANKYAEKGDILISVRAPVGALNEADKKYGIGRGLCSIRSKEFLLFRGFAWFLLEVVKVQLNLVSTGSTYEAVAVADVSNLICSLPPPSEQQAIAQFLDRETAKIDTLIAKKERLIELLKEKRTALISHAVTKGLNPYAPMKDSGVEWLGEMPEEWNLIRLKYGYQTCLGKMLQTSPSSPHDSLEPYLRSANIFWEGVNLADLKEMYFSPYEKSLYELKAGDLVVSEGGDVGRTAIWRGEIDNCYIQNAVHRIRNTERYSNPFLYYWLFFIKSIGYVDLLCNKATIAHFTAEKVKEIPVASPPLTEQQAIAQFLDRETAKIDTLITKTRTSIDKLKEYRTALISAAVTGKIDVREEVIPK